MMNILHCFADTGAETPTLSNYGNVTRIGINATRNEWSQGIKADAKNIPFKDTTRFDIGWFHPPCGFVSPMSDTGSGSRDDWPNLIPVARELAHEYCDYYVIENKPNEHLRDPVVLDGHMFQLGIEYARAFETNFVVEQPPRQSRLAETSPFYYSEKPKPWWASVKGSSMVFSKEHLAKNTIPSVYIDYVMRYYAVASNDEELPDYSDYDDRMRVRRARAVNEELV